jgi:Zn-dependent M28 family amino/carboxypeptidase
VLTGESLELYDQLAPEIGRQLTARKAGAPPTDAQRPFPMIVLARAAASSPLLPSGWPRDDRPQALPGRLSARVDLRHEDVTGYNVVGVVRGADPVLRDSYVAYGAHFDHIGIQPAVNGDSIANGADDDASGSVGLLALARAYARGPRPRRSVLFVWHGAEEKGLLGSEHFAARPTVPLASIVAQINADMIGRNGSTTENGPPGDQRSLFIIGPSAAPNNQSRTLGQIVDSVNARQPVPFVFNREWDSPTHPERIYFRSDHYNYAKKGIPIVFFTDGLHADYHKVSDEAAKIDYAKLGRAARLIHDVVVAVGNRRARPR